MEARRVAKLQATGAAEIKIQKFEQLKLEPAQPVDDWQAALLRRSVTLYALREGLALFFELPEDIDVYSPTTGSFFYDAQLRHVLAVYCLPMAMFYGFADLLAARPTPECVVVSSTGRCGSTLLSQVLESQAGVTSISEPFAYLQCAALLARPDAQPALLGAWLQEKPEAVARAVVLAQLKDFGGGARLVCVKLHSQGLAAVPMLKALFPAQRHLYLYRDSRPNVSSFVRFVAAVMPKPLTAMMSTWCGRLVVYTALYPLLFGGRATMRFVLSNLIDDQVAWARDLRVWASDAHALRVSPAG